MNSGIERSDPGLDALVPTGAKIEKLAEQPDGGKVEQAGNIYSTGPGGVWIFTPEGMCLGTIRPPEVPANLHSGGAGGKMLYITARTGLCRIRLSIAGIRPATRGN
jgi:sugar lactone lactonase YvrE